jgi:hypothetical protein
VQEREREIKRDREREREFRKEYVPKKTHTLYCHNQGS